MGPGSSVSSQPRLPTRSTCYNSPPKTLQRPLAPRLKIPYQQPKKPGVNLLREHHSNESDSDSEDDIPCYLSSDICVMISEADRPIYAALKAASMGDQSAQFFLMEKYSKGELSPPMREMMEAMTEVEKK